MNIIIQFCSGHLSKLIFGTVWFWSRPVNHILTICSSFRLQASFWFPFLVWNAWVISFGNMTNPSQSFSPNHTERGILRWFAVFVLVLPFTSLSLKKNLLIQSWLKAHNAPFLLLLNRVSYSHVVAVQLKQWGLHPVLGCECTASNLGWLGYLRAEFWLTLYVKVLSRHHLHTAGLRSSQNGNEKKEALLFEAVLFEWPRVCDLKLEKLEGQSRPFSCSQ